MAAGVSKEDLAWAEEVREWHKSAHAPSSHSRAVPVPFSRCEAYECEEAREVLAQASTEGEAS